VIGVNERRVPSMVDMRRQTETGVIVCCLPPHGGSFLQRGDQPFMVLRRYSDGVRVHIPDPPTRS
jgi:hypothetical protein